MGCSLLDGFLMSACQGGLISNAGCSQIPKLALITRNDTWEARGIIPGKKHSRELPLVYACYVDLIITANLKLHNGKACFPNTFLRFLGNGHPRLSSKTSPQQAGPAAGGRSSGTQPCLCPAPRGDTAKAPSAQSWLSCSAPWLTLCVQRIDISQWQHVNPRNARRLNWPLSAKHQHSQEVPRETRGCPGFIAMITIEIVFLHLLLSQLPLSSSGTKTWSPHGDFAHW